MKRWLIAVCVGLATWSTTTAAEPNVRADKLGLLLLGDRQPVRLEINVQHDGKSVPEIWDDTFARLLEYCDL
ncbi:MAG: hypothetical protein AB7K24_23640, partial [Gemmataceae bacterium]